MEHAEFGYRESVKDAIELAANSESAIFFKGMAFSLFLYAKAASKEQWTKDRDAIESAIAAARNKKQ